SRRVSKQQDFYPRCSSRNTAPQSRDTPPKRDTGIASEKDWGINLLNESVNESGTNEDGSTWYRESGDVLGDNGYRCRWARMGGQSHDGSSEWKETWWEKSDWTGYKELGAEKSGKNAEGDSWWETWQEVLYQDEWREVAVMGDSRGGGDGGRKEAGREGRRQEACAASLLFLSNFLHLLLTEDGEMQQYLEEKKASQKRPATTFQRQDMKKAVYQQCTGTFSTFP
ncbi:hypothetical protein Taro_044639, partial [Colocasia esculenta]|nr:hypothetical protein [Colocasia esculenta]